MPSPKNERIMQQAADYMAAVESTKAAMTNPMPAVTQADREAAADLFGTSPWGREQWLIGKKDKDPRLTRLARHRSPDTARIAALEEALRGLRDHYIRMIDSGDCGFWEPREEPVVIAATTALGEQP
jgi:hypothetical protein